MGEQTYCEFGGTKGLREMDNVKFMKLAKETGLVDRACTKTDIDLIFVSSKPKGLRRLNFDQYLIALDKIGACATLGATWCAAAALRGVRVRAWAEITCSVWARVRRACADELRPCPVVQRKSGTPAFPATKPLHSSRSRS